MAWEGVDRNQRKCFTCQVVEDEEHVPLHCPRYDHLRIKYLKITCSIRHDISHCIDLLTSKDVQVCNSVCIFIKKALNLHREYKEA